MAESCISADWRARYIVNPYKGNGNALNIFNYMGFNLIKQEMGVLESLVEGPIRSTRCRD